MTPQRTIRLVVAYDGRDFHGFQRQAEARTVQGTLEAALTRLTGEVIRLRGSSRTDAGVHAEGLVASFRTGRTIPVKAFHLGTNSLLPHDLAVQSADEVPAHFDARGATLAKTYHYRIWNAPTRNPLLHARAWHVRKPIDVARVRAALPGLIGAHDCTSFQAANCDSKSTERDIYRLGVARGASADLVIELCANAFLRNMVRIVVGTLVEIGLGKRPVDDLTRLVEARDRTEAGETAPAGGLTLHRVFQEPEALFAYLGREVRLYKTPWREQEKLSDPPPETRMGTEPEDREDR
jgi:tRNA pseudouridine38-40 synthase